MASPVARPPRVSRGGKEVSSLGARTDAREDPYSGSEKQLLAKLLHRRDAQFDDTISQRFFVCFCGVLSEKMDLTQLRRQFMEVAQAEDMDWPIHASQERARVLNHGFEL